MVTEGSPPLSTNSYKYDVFLSFYGDDTRIGFTHELNKALQKAKISTFMDKEVIRTGEDLKPTLKNAIESSRVSIVVLSKNYASSSWCLSELALIIDQYNGASKQIVIPVFYKVFLTHVRKQEDTFGLAMSMHRQRISVELDEKKKSRMAENLHKWIKALEAVADLSGNVVKDRPEREIIEEIVKDVHLRLRIHERNNLPQIFGMDDSINYVTSWLQDGSSNTRDIFTILGMGGIGKTSLAKYVYGLHSHEFDTSCSIGDISGKSKLIGGILSLQKELYDRISYQRSVEVQEPSEYTSMIEGALVGKKVFLFLDDIDSLDQLDALLGSKDFHPGSKILITTKDACLTERCALIKTDDKAKNTMHFLPGLSNTASRLLLCYHAFKSNYPKAGYEEVVEKLVDYCEGHPFALKLLGGSLYKRDVSYWEGYIETLKMGNNSDFIEKVLESSIKSLPSDNDQNLFKHIACFFVGVDKDYTETILKACNINTSVGFTNLTERCLLTIESDNQLMMHQLLQEMGRLLVRKESPEKPWERSRVWCHDESLKVLKQKKGTGNVRGLTLDTRLLKNEELPETFKLETDALCNMDNLMLLQLNFVPMIKGSYVKFPEELRWLCMHGFPLDYISFVLPMKRLVVLDLSYSNIESFGTCYNNPEQPQTGQKFSGSSSKDRVLLGSLKVLDLSFCQKLRRLGRFDGLTALESLTVTYCGGLVEVCESIEKCVELVVIDLSYCNNLEKMPRTIGNLKKVKTLFLSGCNLGEYENEIINMHTDSSVNSTSINTGTSSSAIVKPRESEFFMFLPRSLGTLGLSNSNLCTESFPKDLSFLSNLTDLHLNDNPIRCMPDCLKTVPGLEILYMAGCILLTSVQHPPRTLQFLNLLSVDGQLQKVSFDPEMSPLRLGILPNQIVVPCDIEGILKIQPMKNVEEKVLDSLGWTNPDFPYKKCMETFFADKKPEESKIKMCYEFGIFTTSYKGKEMPNWICNRSEGPSISFTVPLSPNKIRGLNFCSVQMFVDYSPPPYKLVSSPAFKISNETKRLTWIYTCYVGSFRVDGECLILLSHWMFGMNEMKAGDEVTITGAVQVGLTKECGVSFVYDDGKMDEEEEEAENVLGYYKSWNHIIGGDLTGFQLTTGEYILDFDGYARDGIQFISSIHEFVEDGAIYKEDKVWFRAFSHKKSGIVGHTHEQGEDNEGAIGMKENIHGSKANLLQFELSMSQYMDCFSHGTKDEPLILWPLSSLRELDDNDQLGSSHEEDDAEVDCLKSSERSSSFSFNVATNLEEVLLEMSRSVRNVGASAQHVDTVSGLSPKTYLPDATPNQLSSGPLEGFEIPESSTKMKLQKISEDVIQDLDKPLKEDDMNLSSRRHRRRLLMDEQHILDFPAYAMDVHGAEAYLVPDKEVCADDPSGNETIVGSEVFPDSSIVTLPEVSCPVGTPIENMFDKVEAIDAVEGTSESNKQPSCSEANVNDIFAKHRALLVDQAQKMALAAQDIVQMQAEYEESQNKMKRMEAELSVLANRLSHAESQLDISEALREDADKKVLKLEASNSELANWVHVLEYEKKELVERVAVLEVVDADLKWVLREGLPHCFDKVLVSEAFLKAYKRLRSAFIQYGTERGCRLMRDTFQLEVTDAQLPGYKPDTYKEAKEAASSFVDMDFVAAAGVPDLSVDALRAFCSSDKSN